MTLSDRVKGEVSLRGLCESDGIAWDRRRSSDARGDWWACCPFHGEATPSFHVREPKGRDGTFKCFGCGAQGSVVDYVMARDGVDAAEALKRLAQAARIAREDDPGREARDEARRKAREAEREAELKREFAAIDRRVKRAVRIWKQAEASAALLAQYLAARGVDLGALESRWSWPRGVPPSLRLHPRLPAHHPGAREPAHEGPAMVGFIGRGRDFRGVHRTWITATGRARWPLDPDTKVPKMWLGDTGAMFGHPVCLTPPGGRTLVTGEGIETTLALLSALLRQSPGESVSAEAALSLGALTGTGHGFYGRAGHWPPEGTERVVLALEGRAPDPVKDAAARAAGKPTRAERARLEMDAAADRYRAGGFVVDVVPPPGGAGDGRDFADLMAGAV